MAEKRFDAVALGELLVDFTDNGLSEQGNTLFEANPGAGGMLTEKDLPLEVLANCRVFHFGTLSMTHEGVRRTTCKAIDCAREICCYIFDCDAFSANSDRSGRRIPCRSWCPRPGLFHLLRNSCAFEYER